MLSICPAIGIDAILLPELLVSDILDRHFEPGHGVIVRSP